MNDIDLELGLMMNINGECPPNNLKKSSNVQFYKFVKFLMTIEVHNLFLDGFV